jgi:hypothetical protein
MCGWFAQYRGMRDYLRELDSEQEVISLAGDEPVERRARMCSCLGAPPAA